jgi:hypothetical protein
MKTVYEQLLADCAHRSCNKCYGTGRTGFRDGQPINCKCVTRDIKELAPKLTVSARPATQSEAVSLLIEIRRLRGVVKK